MYAVLNPYGYRVGALYGQGTDWETCRPAGFMSKKFTAAQRSYRTFEHKALGVIEALMKWEDKLVGRQFIIVMDHEALKTIKTSNCDGKSGRLIRWDKYLSRFKYEVMHVPGVRNKVADCLSCYYENNRYDEVHESHHYISADIRLDPASEDLTELQLLELDNLKHMSQFLARRIRDRNEDRVFKAEQMAEASRIANIPDPVIDDEGGDLTVADALQNGPSLRKVVFGDKTFTEAVKDSYKSDTTFTKVINNPGHYPIFRVIDGLIHTKNRLGDDCVCIPRSLLKGKRSLPKIVIDQAHDTLGHLGAQKTSEYTRRWFWWPRMGREIEKFCLSCKNCQMSKSSNQLKPGLLHNLPIPSHPWQSIVMDFIGPFPECQGYDYLWVIICRLMNQTHLTPIMVKTTTTDLAWFYIRDIVHLHGMPESIVSDRDSKFTSRFWRELHRSLGTKLLMSTSFHPQTDGHSERIIRSIGQILHSTVSPDQKDWLPQIPLVEFALNSSINSSSGFAPFELNYGYMPRMTPFPSDNIKYRGVKEFAQRAHANIEMAS